MNDPYDWTPLKRDGYQLLSNVLNPQAVEQWISSWNEFVRHAHDSATILKRNDTIYGARDLIRDWPLCVELLAKTRLIRQLISVMGEQAGLVRVLFFDKPPGQSWALPWHRDLSIAVKENHWSSEQFTKPTIKHGVPHVEAPQWLLEDMLTIRIHLDPMTSTNGPLRVQVGSHRDDSEGPVKVIYCDAGDALAMRPLLLHSSGESEPTTAEHRRILHFEFATSCELPDRFVWRDFILLNDRVK